MTAREWVTINMANQGRAFVEEHYEQCVAESEQKVSTESFSRYIRDEWRQMQGRDPELPRDYEQIEDGVLRSSHVSTIPDLLDYAKVDTALFRVKRARVSTYGTESCPGRQVRLELEPRGKAINLQAILEDFKIHAAAYAPTYQPPQVNGPLGLVDNLLELCIPDFHYGQLSVPGETAGDRWNRKVAEETYRQCIRSLVESARPYGFNKILFVIGNDFFNVDNHRNMTAAGTPQDEDGKWFESFSAAWKLQVEVIDYMRQYAPVHVIRVPANHDLERSYYLTEVLSAWYGSAKDVTIENSVKPRVYHRHGNCLIGFTHKGKLIDLALHMATDEPELWAKTRYREYHVAHLHHLKADEIQKVRVMVIPSLAPESAWSSGEGYGHLREGQAHLWNPERGKIVVMHYHPQPCVDELYSYRKAAV